MKYFEDGNRDIVKKDLFTTVAENWAKKLGEIEEYNAGNRRPRPKRRSNSKSQIRKFFDEILRYRTLVENADNQNDEFRKQLPYINMTISKAAYSIGRDKITTKFKEFIEENLKGVNDFKDFKVFCQLFEAVVAYSNQYVSKD